MPPRGAAAALLCALACAALAVNPLDSSTGGWVTCSVQDAVCECEGSVRYGAMTSWSVHAGVQGIVSCSAAVFGDPLYGVFKHCQCKEEWLPCASEDGECRCEGSVRYGAAANWTVKHDINGTIACTVAEFGDPAPGVTKACECIAVDTCTDLTFANGPTWHDSRGAAFTCEWYGGDASRCPTDGRGYENAYTANEACCACGGGKRTHTNGVLPPVPTPMPMPASDDWVPCSVENAVCECKGSVRFGAMTSWYVRDNVFGPISCSGAEFGDPLEGVFKHCECKEEWIPCAAEDYWCRCEGSVRYGSLNWTVKNDVHGTIACNSAEFVDPDPGFKKLCECIAVDTCTDLTFSNGSAWHDSRGSGFTCEWYGGNSSRCPTDGRENENVFTANEACCACGGGKRTHTNGVSLLPSPDDWVACSVANTACECNGFVRYGAMTSWSTVRYVHDSIMCAKYVFGDPLFGVFKHCQCQERWRPCASENNECRCEGSVRYGASPDWTVKHDVNGTIACNSAEFGDPAPGVTKACECIAVDTCTDLTFANGSAWHDSRGSGFTCEWYSGDSSRCPTDGRGYENAYTANEACCVCGGGKRAHTTGALPIAPTPTPTAAPTLAPAWQTAVPTSAPTLVPTPVPSIAPTPVPTAMPIEVPTPLPGQLPTPVPTPVSTASPTPVPGLVPSDTPASAETPMPSIAPTPTITSVPGQLPTPVPTASPTPAPGLVPSETPTSAATSAPTAVPGPGCRDLAFPDGKVWHSSLGPAFTCAWYGSNGTLCAAVGGQKYRDVHTADEACCVCGGGAPASPTTSSPSSPGGLPTAVWVTLGATAAVLLVCAVLWACVHLRRRRQARQGTALDPHANLLRSSIPMSEEEELTGTKCDRTT